VEERKQIKFKDEIREMNCNEVYEQFKKFIFMKAHGFHNTGANVEDLIQMGNVGLVKAFNSYKSESKNTFSTYLGIVVNNEILMNIRKLKKIRNEISFSAEIATDKCAGVLTISDIIKDPIDYEDLALKPIINADIKKLLNELKPLSRKAIELFYFKEISQYRISEELNYSQSYISRILMRSLKILRNKYEGLEVAK
jgi:RNA polymerase sporulation-specific sigma factor